MKTNFSGRPINHRLPERIKAHFMISTLKNMNAANIHDVEYMALYNGSRTLKALTGMTPLGLDRLHYRPKDLNGKIKKILT